MSIYLYELTAEYRQALDNITVDEETGEVIGFEELDAIDAAYDKKAINCALYVIDLEKESEVIKAEEERLKQRREATTKKAARIKQHISDCMHAAGKDKISDPRVRLSFRNNAPSVNIFDATTLPEKYFKIKREPMKAEIKNDIKSGIDVPGAELVRTVSLQIK